MLIQVGSNCATTVENRSIVEHFSCGTTNLNADIAFVRSRDRILGAQEYCGPSA